MLQHVLIPASWALLKRRSRSAGSRTSASTWYFFQSVCNDLRQPSQNETSASRICQQATPPVGLACNTNRWTNWQLTANSSERSRPDLMLAPAPPAMNRGAGKARGTVNRTGFHRLDRASRWIRQQKEERLSGLGYLGWCVLRGAGRADFSHQGRLYRRDRL